MKKIKLRKFITNIWFFILLCCISKNSLAQFIVEGLNTSIVCDGNPVIVFNDLSYINNASQNHFISDSSKVIFVGNGLNTVAITSNLGLNTDFGVLEINRPNGVVLQAPINIADTLFLVNGILDISNFNLDMQSGLIVGGAISSYVKTSSLGMLQRNVSANTTVFPVGNSSYNPCVLENLGISDLISLRVADNVTDDGTAIGLTTNSAVVKRTWFINELDSGGSSLKIKLVWNGNSEEINGFQSAPSFMTRFDETSSLWDNIGGIAGSNFIETENNDSLGVFSISSSHEFAPLNNAELVYENTMISIPNPSYGDFEVDFICQTYSGESVFEIRDIEGRVVRSLMLDLQPGFNKINISDLDLSSGIYYLQILTTKEHSQILRHRVL